MNGRTLLLIKLSTHSLAEYCTVYQTHARKHTHKHPVAIRISISIFNRNNGMVLQMLIVISINPICSHCDTRDMTKVCCGVSPILLSNYIYIYRMGTKAHRQKGNCLKWAYMWLFDNQLPCPVHIHYSVLRTLSSYKYHAQNMVPECHLQAHLRGTCVNSMNYIRCTGNQGTWR